MPAISRQHAGNQSGTRRRMYAAILIQFKQMRRDLHHDDEALRDERLAFITSVLGLKRPLSTMSALSIKQLGDVLAHFKKINSRSPSTPSSVPMTTVSAAIIHLATAEQVHAIGKLFGYLDWSVEARAAFVADKFNRPNIAMLTPTQARSLMTILFTVAASRDLKAQGANSVSRKAAVAYIPTLKQIVGIK